jgi:hypothetical protein
MDVTFFVTPFCEMGLFVLGIHWKDVFRRCKYENF